MRSALLALSLALLAAAAPASEPSDTEWRSVDLDDYQILFPEGLEEVAQRTAALLEATRGPVSEEWQEPPGHLPLILHPHTVQSNAFVAPVPFKSEWVTAPPADPIFGTADWLRLLATHEFRHVNQFESLRTGWSFGRFLQILYGPLGLALHSVVTWPRWFAEGDAVLTETLLSDGGRGRLPSFYEQIQAAMLEGMRWDLLDIHYGSYTRYVPGPYEMGYFLAARIRTASSERAWRKAINHARAGFPRRFYLTGLYHSLDTHTRKGAIKWVEATLKDLDRRFDTARELTPSARSAWLIPQRRSATSYRHPQPLPDGRLLAFKTSADDAPALVALDARGGEEVLARPDLPFTGLRYHVRGHTLAYAREWGHPRWDVVAESNLYLRDLASGQVRQLTQGGRYFHPWIAEDGRRLAAAWVPGDGSDGWIGVLDLATGIQAEKIPAPAGCLLLSPVWVNGSLAAIKRSREGWHGVVLWDEAARAWKDLLALEKTVYADLWADEGRLYLMSPRDGASEIYELDPADPRLRRLTVSRSGSLFPAVAKGVLYFCERDALGLKPATAPLAQASPPEPTGPRLVNVISELLPDSLAAKEEIDKAAQAATRTVKASRAFSPWEQSFQVVGWSFLGLLVTGTPEVAILSYDPMGTLLLQAAAGADTEHGTGWGSVYAQYLRPYLPLDIGVDAGTYVQREAGLPDDVFEAQNLGLGLSLPLLWHDEGWTRQLLARAEGGYRHIGPRSLSSTSAVGATDFAGGQALLAFQWLKDGGAKHLQAPWGLALAAAGIQTEAVGLVPGWARAAEAEGGLYLPGLFRHDGLLVEGAYGRQVGARYSYSAFGRFAAGYYPVSHPEFWTGAAHYVFPLGYPEWKIKYPGYYLRRVFGRLFYEHTWGSGPSDASYRSFGGLLYLDMGMFYNDFVQPTIGIGAIRRVEDNVTILGLDFRSSF